MARQSECLPSNLLVDIALQLKNNPAHGQSHGPVVELSLSFTHTLLIALSVDTDVGAHALVKLVVHPPQPPLDGLFCDLEC